MKVLILSLVLVLLNSCIHQEFQASDSHSDKFHSHSAVPIIQYPKQNKAFTLIKEEIKDDYTIKTYQCKDSYYTLPPEKEPHTLTIEVFSPKNFTRPAPVLVLPISGGEYFFARYFSKAFAQNGLQAVFVHRQKKYLQFKELKQIDPNLRQLIIDHRIVIDWLETQKNLNFQKLACFGISLGGIKTILISGNEPRIKYTIAYLAGSDLPQILTESTEKGVVKRRKHLLEKYKFSLEELHENLKKNITIEPSLYAQNIDPKSSFIVTARFDNAVPYSAGQKLYKSLNQPLQLTIYTGHYTAMFLLPYLRYKAVDFLLNKMNMQ